MKKIIAAMVLGTSLVTTSVVGANPVTMNGETSAKFVREHEEGSFTQSGMVYTLTLLAEAEVAKNMSFYTRLGAQHTRANQVGSDFNTDVYPSKRSVLAIDQYGFILKQEGFTYKLGRQDAAVGATGLLYSRANSNIGKRSFIDGLSVAGTAGSANITALLAREDNISDKNRVYAVRTGFSPSEQWDFGVTLGRFQNTSADSTNHWALDGTYKLGKNSWTAEYSHSNSSVDNKAFALVWDYAADSNTNLSITNFRVGANGDMGGQSDFANNTNGIHYGIKHALKENTSLELVWKDEENRSTDAKLTTFEATVSYTF